MKPDPGLFPVGELEVLHGAIDDVAGRVLMTARRKLVRTFVPHKWYVKAARNESLKEVLSQNKLKM